MSGREKDFLVSAVEFSLPRRIHLAPAPRMRWKNPTARDAVAARLEEAGFERVGSYSVDEMPDIRILGMIHRERNLLAAVCENGTSRWTDVIRYHANGSTICVTNVNVTPGARFSSRRKRNVYLTRAGPAKLLERMDAEKPPAAGIEPLTPSLFARRYEKGYKDELQERRDARR